MIRGKFTILEFQSLSKNILRSKICSKFFKRFALLQCILNAYSFTKKNTKH